MGISFPSCSEPEHPKQRKNEIEIITEIHKNKYNTYKVKGPNPFHNKKSTSMDICYEKNNLVVYHFGSDSRKSPKKRKKITFYLQPLGHSHQEEKVKSGNPNLLPKDSYDLKDHSERDTNITFDFDKGRTLSTFIYFNKLIKDEEREISAIAEVELSHSMILTSEQKGDNTRKNVMSDEDNDPFNKLAGDIKQRKNDITVKNHIAITSMPLQRFAYEDLGNSEEKKFTILKNQKIKSTKNSLTISVQANKHHSNTLNRPTRYINYDEYKASNHNKNININCVNDNKAKPSKLTPRNDQLIISLPNFDTKICKELFHNDKEILLNQKKLKKLSYGIIFNSSLLDSVIFDGELFKLNANKNGYKKVMRYFQISKKEFKYYNSIFSSSVWNDRPLFRVNVEDIENISISTDDRIKIKFNDLGFVFLMTVNISGIKSFNDPDNEFIQYDKSDFKEKKNEKIILQFACEDQLVGTSLIQIMLMVKKLLPEGIN